MKNSMRLRFYDTAVLVLLCTTLGVGCSEQLGGGIVDEDGEFGLGPAAIKAEKEAQDSDNDDSDNDDSDKDSSGKDGSDKDGSETDTSDKEGTETGTSNEESSDQSEDASTTDSSEESSSEESSTDSTDETISKKLSISFTTQGYNGRYGPYHVGAVWIENKDGSFVRTVRQWGEVRQRHLVKWKAASGSNTTDAVTGATLYDHESHRLSWDLRGSDGKAVPDGDYVLCVEFTEENSSLMGIDDGPSLEVPFRLGASGETLTPADSSGYLDVELVVP